MDKSEQKKHYSESFRRMIVRESLTSGMSVKDIAKKYDLPHFNTVTVWRRYYKNDLDDIADLLVKPSTPEEKQELAMYISKAKQLEKDLANANLKVVALETMIDIAEKGLNIKIRKKSGTKQSKR